jgi:hypothetical protein
VIRVDCREIRLDLEAYSLGALEGREARRVERHLKDCRDCAGLARAYRVAVDQLPYAVPIYRPGPRLRQIVLGSVGALRPSLSPAALVRGSRWWAAAAVVFLAVGIGAIAWAASLSAEVRELKADNARLAELTHLSEAQRAALLRFQSELFSTQTQLYTTQSAQERLVKAQEEQNTLIVLALDPALEPTELGGTEIAPQASCRYVWSAQQSLGALTCTNLPSTNVYAYQLWIDRGNDIISGGVFTPTREGSAQHLVKMGPNYDEGYGEPFRDMWVTLETSSDARNPSEDVVLVTQPAQNASR